MLWPTSSSDDFLIVAARSRIELTSAAALLRAYAKSLPVDLAPQGFSQELASLPGAYAPPCGELLLAKRGDHVLGCIALKPLEPPRVAEIKRLFVRPQARAKGVGKALVQAAIATAETLGYAEIKLDTLPGMEGAIALYKASGFVPIPPYGSHPYPGLVTLGKTLSR
jgi:GNAT superfamily N-acetyltransferase